jgi:putative membrane protein
VVITIKIIDLHHARKEEIMRQVLILLPALIHVYIFVLESLLWGGTRTNKVFAISEEDARVMKQMAFNQGIYNLMLAAAIVAGFLLTLAPDTAAAGKVLAVYGLGSILVAGVVLLASSPKLWKSALVQIVPATAGLAALLV